MLWGDMGLTNKRKAFVQEYPKDFNATQAAIRAGYSEKTAYSIGQELLKIPEIADEIKSSLDERAMSADEVLLRLAEQARGDHSKYLTGDGVDMDALIADGKAHLVKAIKPTAHGMTIEFYDAQSALALIGKHHKLFVERHEHTGADGGELNIGVKFIDYRNDIAPPTPGPGSNSGTPSKD
jgi:phage terminase small subunit